jgi:hypothetical protein
MAKIDKHQVLARIRNQLAAKLEAAILQQKNTQSGAFHEENKAEGSKDTRSTEASYLARGLAQRVADLQTDVAVCAGFVPRSFAEDEAIGLGALFCLQDEAENNVHYFLAPAEGGLLVELDNRPNSDKERVKVITAKSPLGRAVLGKHLGDAFDYESPTGTKELCVVELS